MDTTLLHVRTHIVIFVRQFSLLGASSPREVQLNMVNLAYNIVTRSVWSHGVKFIQAS